MRWLGYSRVSRVGDRGERLISPELQQQRIRAYALAKGIEVEMLAPELDVSGGAVERPILGAAIEQVESGEAAGIIVAQLDRLSRAGIIDTLKVIEKVEAGGGKVIAVAENFDDSTPEGRMARNIMLSLAELQLDRYKTGFRAAKERAVREGIWPVQRVPIGYRRGADRRLVPGPDAALVVSAFEARAAGASWAKVGAILGRGNSGAGKVIRNRVYLGEVRVGEWVNRAAHPALVSVALFESAQIAHPRPPRGVHGPALLSGLLRCAGCQMTLHVDHDGQARYYRCRHARSSEGLCQERAFIAAGRIEPRIEAAVLAHASAISYSAAESTAAIEEGERGLEAAEAELLAFQVATSALGGEFAAGLRSRVEALEKARGDLARLRIRSVPALAAGNLAELWPRLSVEERRHLLRGSLGVVWVRKGGGVRAVEAGYEPSDLPRSGRRSGSMEPIDWEADLDGEVRVPTLEDIAQGAGGTGS